MPASSSLLHVRAESWHGAALVHASGLRHMMVMIRPRPGVATNEGYSKRSMVENTMYRYKTIIGRSMRSRTSDGQRVEVQRASKILKR